MYLVGPEHGVGAVVEQRVAVELALRIGHQRAQAAHAHLTTGAFRVEGLFEFVTHRDIDEVSVRTQHFLIKQVGLCGLADTRIAHEAVEQDHLAKI